MKAGSKQATHSNDGVGNLGHLIQAAHMGYILTPIAVDLKQVSAEVGSKNTQLLAVLVDTFSDGFEQFDEMAVNASDEEAGQQPLTMRAALTQMIMGEEYDKSFGFMYGYAFEFICRYFGDYLPNNEWWAMPSGSWAATVDQEMGNVGVPANVLRVEHHLMYCGAPIAIPESDGFPGIGYLTGKEIETAQKAFGEAKLAAITDKSVLTSILEIQGWLTACALSSRDLVCFYA